MMFLHFNSNHLISFHTNQIKEDGCFEFENTKNWDTLKERHEHHCQIFLTTLTTVNIARSKVLLSNLHVKTNTGKKKLITDNFQLLHIAFYQISQTNQNYIQREIKYLNGQDIIPDSSGFPPSLAEALTRISEISKQNKEVTRIIFIFPWHFLKHRNRVAGRPWSPCNPSNSFHLLEMYHQVPFIAAP